MTAMLDLKKTPYAPPISSPISSKVFSKPCRFIASADSLNQLPSEGLPEIAFTGRSNVGKSSLLNAITGQNKLARVAQTPGRTRRINLFDCGETLRLVDLPGYGYARAGKGDIKAWQKASLNFLQNRQQLARVLLLIDCRRGVGDADKEMMAMLDAVAVAWTLVLTKCDKLSASEREAIYTQTSQTLTHHPAAWGEVFMTAAQGYKSTGKTKTLGIDALRGHIILMADRGGGR